MTTDYTEPLPKLLSISKLKLDPNNKRLLLHGAGTSEPELISRLCSLKDTNTPIRIIKNIKSDNAFIRSLCPHVLKEGRHFTVVDGNSRVAALKMILDPSLIPSNRHKLRKDCESLAGLIEEKIPCWVCLDKSKAQRIVYRIHNEGSREWDTLGKYSVYYDDYVLKNLTVNEIALYAGQRYTPAIIAQKINTWQLVEYLVAHGDGFLRDSTNITSFERITVEYSEFAKFFGLIKNKEGIYTLPGDDSLYDSLLKIYRDSVDTRGFSRNANDSSGRETVYRKLFPEANTGNQKKLHANIPKSGGSFIDGKRQAISGPAPANTKTKPTRSAVIQPPSNRQILAAKKNVGQKASKVFDEFIRLQPESSYPISSAALARTMIENTLKHHAKRLGCYSESVEQQQKNWSEALGTIANNLKAHIIKLKLPYSSDLVSSISATSKCVGELNDVLHKDSVFAARAAVATTWDTLASAVADLVKIPDK